MSGSVSEALLAIIGPNDHPVFSVIKNSSSMLGITVGRPNPSNEPQQDHSRTCARKLQIRPSSHGTHDSGQCTSQLGYCNTQFQRFTGFQLGPFISCSCSTGLLCRLHSPAWSSHSHAILMIGQERDATRNHSLKLLL